MSDETAKKPEALMVTPVEQAALSALCACRNACMEKIEWYKGNVVGARLGIHPNRIANINTDTGLITLASDAPAPVAPEEAAKA